MMKCISKCEILGEAIPDHLLLVWSPGLPGISVGIALGGILRNRGDIFGHAGIEATVAFFLESSFIGLWVFGWKRVSKTPCLSYGWWQS